MTLGLSHIIGMILVIALIVGVGLYSGRKVHSAADFTTGGGKAGAWLVAGTIMGTLVSGQATIGTAQLAFRFGMSAWWFTLGSGIGCLLLALVYAAPMRRSKSTTLIGVISDEYGSQSGYIASVLSSTGIFVSVISQMLAATALLTTILPINLFTASVLSAAIMAVYVIFGGVWGAGIGGIVKFLLMYVSAVVGGAVVLSLGGGFSGLAGTLETTLVGTELGMMNGITKTSDLWATFGSLVARGPMKDLGSGLSLILGVLSTQTYASAIWSAKSDRAAKCGALLSTCLIPPIGIMCILIGLFMRGQCITTAEIDALTAAGQAVPAGMIEIATTAQVFPMFVLHYLPKFFGGIVLGTLLIAIIGGGAGLSLGVATIVIKDIGTRVLNRLGSPSTQLIATRIVIVAVLAISSAIAIMVPSAIINDIGYLSMGLRGAVAFAPLCTALFLPKKIHRNFALAAIILGPVLVLVGNFVLPAGTDPLFPGLNAAVITLFIGFIAGQIRGHGKINHSKVSNIKST